MSGKQLVQVESPDSEANKADDGEKKSTHRLRGAGAFLLAVEALAASRPLQVLFFLRCIEILFPLVVLRLLYHFGFNTCNHYIHSNRAYSNFQYLR